MLKILLVGYGRLGQRYFQGLISTDLNFEITILETKYLDINQLNLDLHSYNAGKTSLIIINKLRLLAHDYDIAIIATTASKRGELIANISKIANVRYWIIEKILTQSLHDSNILRNSIEQQTKAWVNYTRRAMSFYREIKEYLPMETPLIIRVEGRDWNLASNAIHFIDLTEFLFDTKLQAISTKNLDHKWRESKREGFVEIGGELICNFAQPITLIISSKDKFDDTDYPITISIYGKNLDCKIMENGLEIAAELNKKPIHGSIELQSQITKSIVEEILSSGNCKLVNLEEALGTHNIYITELLSHFNQKCDLQFEQLQIT